ncbi:MAG: dihydrodipicolinate synthase family protein [Flaviflexus sp.]|nr:dihydrodipicolinate synthase family protein [Flaviflexus sp.]
MSAKLRGVIPPVVTPLTEDRRLDVASFERSINRMIEAGVDGLFFLGSSGEVVFSTDARREEILTEAVRITAGRVPVLAGVIDTQTSRVIEHIAMAERLGVDGVVATAPFYALGGPAEIERHFRALREATQLPIYAYDIPVCVHTKLPVSLLVRLGQDGVLDGVKDSSGDDVSFRFLALANKKAGSPLSLLTGHEVVVDGAYLAGADGSVPGLANIDPEGYVRQWRAFEAGDWEAVRTEQDRLAELMRITQVTTGAVGFGAGVGAFKAALMLLGVFESNQMPEPVAKLDGDNLEAIKQVLAEAGLL